MSQMTVRYFIELASNIGQRAKSDAQMLAESHRGMDSAINRTADQVGGLQRRMHDLTASTSTQRQIDYFDKLGRSIDTVKQKASNLKQAIANGVEKLPELGAAATAGYMGGKQVMLPPMKAFADLETATVDLQVALTDSKGKVDKSFSKIAAEAERLGQKLPGSTKDYMGGARSLIEQGMSGDQVANGGLAASSNFAVLMGMDPASAAKTIAKTREAYGLGDKDFGYAADYMQRARYGFGIDPGDFLEVGKYAAPTYNALGLTGRDNFTKLLGIQGMAAGVGLEASSFGTNFSQMLSRLAEIDPKLGKNSKKSKEMSALLASHGIDLEFYDKKGEFGGIENMLGQLAKLRKLSTLDRQRVSSDLFGTEAGRPAMILAERGLEEYQKAMNKLRDQADIDTRINMKMDTFAAKLDALGGTIEGVLARIGAPLGGASKPWIDGLNGKAGGIGDFFQEHPGLATTALVGGTALTGLLAARGGGALVRMLLGRAAATAAPVAATAAAVAGAEAGAASGAARVVYGTRDARLSAYRTAVEEARASSRTAQAWAPIERTAAMASRAASVGHFAMRAMPWLGLGLESYGVLSDDSLSGMGKARGLGAAASGFAGGWGGASMGAALGTAILPGVGTVVGGLAGGAMGYFGGKAAFGAAWQPDAKRDFVQLTAPDGSGLGTAAAGQATTVQLGEGRMTVDVRVTDERVLANPYVTQQPSLVKINPGATNPGGMR